MRAVRLRDRKKMIFSRYGDEPKGGKGENGKGRFQMGGSGDVE